MTARPTPVPPTATPTTPATPTSTLAPTAVPKPDPCTLFTTDDAQTALGRPVVVVPVSQPAPGVQTCTYMIPGVTPAHIATFQIDWLSTPAEAQGFYAGVAALSVKPPQLLSNLGDAAEVLQFSDGTFLVVLQGTAVIQLGMSNPTVPALQREARSVLQRLPKTAP